MSRSRTHGPAKAALRLEAFDTRLNPVSFKFDFSLDTAGFFSNPAARDALQLAADAITPKLHDDLAAITSTGGNNWQAMVANPLTGGIVNIDNPAVGQDELLVFVNAGSLGGTELGLASSGGFSVSGSQQFVDLVRGRGQAGALNANKTDFAPWGGLLSFSNTANWNFGNAPLTGSQFDFDSVAQHEILHLLGFGLGDQSFDRHIVNGQFAGANTVAVNGGPAALAGNQHFGQGVTFNGKTSVQAPQLQAGEKREVSALEFAVLKDIGWEVSDAQPKTSNPTPAPIPTPVGNTNPVAQPIAQPAANGSPSGMVTMVQMPNMKPCCCPLCMGGVTNTLAVSGANGEVQVFGRDENGLLVARSSKLTPFPGFTGQVRAVTADVNGDQVADLIVATGPNGGSQIRVLDGNTFQDIVTGFSAFEDSFTGGVFVAAGDFNADGKAEIVVTPDQGGGGRTKVIDVSGGSARTVADFLGIDDKNFRGGARAATGDVNGDGTADLIVAAGFGGGPRVAVFDGQTVTSSRPGKIVDDFFAFEPNLRNGVYVTAADLNSDGKAELIFGAGPGGAPRVLAVSGQTLLTSGTQAALANPVANFFAGDVNNRGGVRVAAKDLDANKTLQVVTGSGENGDGRLAVYAADELVGGVTRAANTLSDLSWMLPGVYVG